MINIIILILLILFLFIISKKENFINNKKLDTAVIVEPRKHNKLIPVVKNFIENLPENTIIQIFHGTKNLELIKNGLGKYIKSGKIILNNLNKENLTINEYNILLTSEDFYKKIPGENILIFQTDTGICSENKNNIYKFLNYDYVGAPWFHRNEKGGNGGLSFRKKSKMIKYCHKFKNFNEKTEDIFFSNLNLNYPNKELAKQFSVENIYFENPFGFHKPWDNMNNELYNKLKKKCRNLEINFPEQKPNYYYGNNKFSPNNI
jgi:hypothetical protein